MRGWIDSVLTGALVIAGAVLLVSIIDMIRDIVSVAP